MMDFQRLGQEGARAVGRALESLGFSVESGENADRKEFFRLWARFKSRLSPGDVAAFYFSCHALEMNGGNYLAPRDVEPLKGVTEKAESVLKDSSISLNDLLAELRLKRLQVSLQIIDACRENPFADANPNSVYTRSLLPLLVQPGLSLTDVAKKATEFKLLIRRNPSYLA
jgi:uncharacterized caspase-like protein